jgi:hypothetical protein
MIVLAGLAASDWLFFGDADTSFKKGDEIDAFVNVSLLATLLLW